MVQSALEHLVEKMTLADLATRSGRSVAEIVEYAIGPRRGSNGASRPTTTASNASPARTQSGPSIRPRRTRKVNTRTPAGRVAYEKALLGALTQSESPASAVELRAVVGGTPQQARATLNRLIEAGKVSFQGKARATKYSLR